MCVCVCVCVCVCGWGGMRLRVHVCMQMSVYMCIFVDVSKGERDDAYIQYSSMSLIQFTERICPHKTTTPQPQQLWMIETGTGLE